MSSEGKACTVSRLDVPRPLSRSDAVKKNSGNVGELKLPAVLKCAGDSRRTTILIRARSREEICVPLSALNRVVNSVISISS